MNSDDIFNKNLLQDQLASNIYFMLGDYFSYESTLEGLEEIYNRDNHIEDFRLDPDIPALEAAILNVFARINITDVSFRRYNFLYNKKINGEFRFSLEPNKQFIVGNIFGVLSNYYILLGTIGVYNRRNNQPIFGI